MGTEGAWKKAVRHILVGRKPVSVEDGCRVVGPHGGPTLNVASDGEEVIQLCLHHAKAWSESDECRDFAAAGHTDAFRVLSDWISYKSSSASVQH